MTATAVPQAGITPKIPSLPEAKPETLGLSRLRLQAMSDAFKREIDKGTVPGVTVLVARRGQVGWFEAIGKQSPTSAAPMAHDSIFRIFSMTKPIVSVGIMALVEDGDLLLSDAVAKFIPEFANQKVGVVSGGKLELVPAKRPMTVQDLLRHTSGLTYENQGDGPVHKLYQDSRVRSRKISNAEHAALVASFPLVCHPARSSTTAAPPTSSAASPKSSAANPSARTSLSASSPRSRWPRPAFRQLRQMPAGLRSPSQPIPGPATRSRSSICWRSR